MRQMLRNLQSQCKVIWANHDVRRAFIVVGTLTGVSLYFFPIFNKIYFKDAETKALYDKENYYLARKKKLQEEEKRNRLQAMQEQFKLSQSQSQSTTPTDLQSSTSSHSS